MWSIWFCNELLPEHKRVLQNALKALIKFSKDEGQWSSQDNPLHSLVHFFSLATLKEIVYFWKMWYNEDVEVDSVESMKSARQAEITKRNVNSYCNAILGVYDACSSLALSLSSEKFDHMKAESLSYLESGTVFAETLSGDALTSKKTSVNMTLYERRDGKYTAHFGACPFRCFQHVSTPGDIGAKKFPLLASSFGQFSNWVSCTASILQNQLANVSFTFNSLDALDFCQSWEIECSKKLFDFIFATNVIDYVAPPAFILAVIRLLKGHRYFLLSTMVYYHFFPTAAKYIEASFGFDLKWLPVICGVRCVNHKGESYASSVSPDHIPFEKGHVETSLSLMREKVLVFEKVIADPLLIESLMSCPDISRSLCKSFQISCSPLLSKPEGLFMLDLLCTASVLVVLTSFEARLSSGPPRSHTFWEKLCADLVAQEEIALFLTSIQIQALVYGVHLHIVLSSSTCPMCNNKPLSSYLGLFCLEVKVESLKPNPINFFMIQLQVQNVIQYVDCAVETSGDSMVLISFLAPLAFVEHRFTLYQYYLQQVADGPNYRNAAHAVLQGVLREYRVYTTPLLPPYQPQPERCSSLGNLTKHCGNRDAFESTLSFAVDGLPALLTAEVKLNKFQSLKYQYRVLIAMSKSDTHTRLRLVTSWLLNGIRMQRPSPSKLNVKLISMKRMDSYSM